MHWFASRRRWLTCARARARARGGIGARTAGAAPVPRAGREQACVRERGRSSLGRRRVSPGTSCLGDSQPSNTVPRPPTHPPAQRPSAAATARSTCPSDGPCPEGVVRHAIGPRVQARPSQIRADPRPQRRGAPLIGGHVLRCRSLPPDSSFQIDGWAVSRPLIAPRSYTGRRAIPGAGHEARSTYAHTDPHCAPLIGSHVLRCRSLPSTSFQVDGGL